MIPERAHGLFRYCRKVVAEQGAANVGDHELVERFALRQDQTAFAALVRRHGPMVLCVCRRILHNVSDAEDAFQATFLVLSRKAGMVRRQGCLGSWLYGVAYRVALRARASGARRRVHESRVAQQPERDPLGELTLREALAGVNFNTGEGLIQLKGRGTNHPEKIEGIKVGARFSRLYVLHATQWGGEKAGKKDALVGYYTVNYEDQDQKTIPIVYGQDVRDWWHREYMGPSRAEVAWQGTNDDATKRNSATLRLYMTRWTNPDPACRVVSIDFTSTNSDVAPFCVAMTVEE